MTTQSKGLLAKELRGTRLFVGLQGAAVRCVDSNGVVRWELGLLAGRYFGDEYSAYMGRGDRIEVQGGAFVRPGGSALGRMAPMSFGERAYKSGANSDWVAPERTIEQREQAMEKRLRKKMERQFEKREQLFARQVMAKKETQVIEQEATDGKISETPDQQKQEQQVSAPQGGDETGQVQLQKEGVKTDG